MLCDFGLARINPGLSKEEQELKELRKRLYKKVLAADSETDRASREVDFRKKVSKKL